jgi:hypothetical protein
VIVSKKHSEKHSENLPREYCCSIVTVFYHVLTRNGLFDLTGHCLTPLGKWEKGSTDAMGVDPWSADLLTGGKSSNWSK